MPMRIQSAQTLATAVTILVLVGCLTASKATEVNDTSAAVLFAVGDIADCSFKNPSLISASALSDEEVAEHQLWLGARLPSEPLDIEELIEDQPGIVLALGDLAYPKGTPEQYADCFASVWRPLVSRTYPVLGNHEHMTNDVGYRSFWGKAAGDTGNYYSFDYGAWHLLALNSEIDAMPGSAQANFVEADLVKSQSDCVLAFFHRPAFASLQRSHSEHAKELFQLLAKQHATLVLNGHNHYYERTAPLDGDGNAEPTGMREFIVGTGGKSEHYSPITLAPYSDKLILDRAGVVKLELLPTEYKWEFIAAPSGEVLDSGSAACGRSAFLTRSR